MDYFESQVRVLTSLDLLEPGFQRSGGQGACVSVIKHAAGPPLSCCNPQVSQLNYNKTKQNKKKVEILPCLPCSDIKASS